MDDRLMELEKRMAFQDRLLEELNQAVVDHQKTLDSLSREMGQLREHLRSGDLMKKPQDELPPPHY